MDKSIDHIGACELSSAVSNRDSWPLASAGGGHLNGEVGRGTLHLDLCLKCVSWIGCCALCCRICNALVAEGGSLELLIGLHWALCGDLLGWRPHIHNGGGGGLQGGDGGSHWGGRQHNGGMQLH